MKRVALYARVSTNKHKCRACRSQFAEKTGSESNCPKCGSSDIARSQTPETQLLPLRQYVQARGASQVFEYIDRESSGKDRPRLNALTRDARKRLFDVVVIVRFDRFARSTKELLLALDEFKALDIDFVSLNEAIDTGTPIGKFFFTIVAAFAELERNVIRERVQAGVDRARKQGKQLGRPRVDVDPLQVAGLRANGYSWNEIARKLGVGRGTAERAYRTLSQKPLGTAENASLIQ